MGWAALPLILYLSGHRFRPGPWRISLGVSAVVTLTFCQGTVVAFFPLGLRPEVPFRAVFAVLILGEFLDAVFNGETW